MIIIFLLCETMSPLYVFVALHSYTPESAWVALWTVAVRMVEYSVVVALLCLLMLWLIVRFPTCLRRIQVMLVYKYLLTEQVNVMFSPSFGTLSKVMLNPFSTSREIINN